MQYTTKEMKSGQWLVLDERQQPIISTDSEEDALNWIRAASQDDSKQVAERLRIATDALEYISERNYTGAATVARDALTQMSVVE